MNIPDTIKKDILERLESYNPPDRTTDEQQQIAQDIYDAANEIRQLREGIDTLKKTADNFIVKYDKLEKHVEAAFMVAGIHGMGYNGSDGNWGVELNALRKACK